MKQLCVGPLFLLIALISSKGMSATELAVKDAFTDLFSVDLHEKENLKHHTNAVPKRHEKEGFFNIDAHKKLFDDGKTRLVGSLTGQSVWKKGLPTYKSGAVRLDAQKSLFKNNYTRVEGKAFLERAVDSDVTASNKFGAGIEVLRTILQTKHNGLLEAYGEYERLWKSHHNHIANFGLKWVV